jgi:hypothetical protein
VSRHKFEIGRVVRALVRRDGVIPPGDYEVIRQLPSQDADKDVQYRIKSVRDGHERIVKESELS